MNFVKSRLSVMNFLEFAVWGAYLTCMSNYLGRAGMGAEIAWFYAIQGIVSIFMPTIMGIVAARFIRPQRLLGLCHLVAGVGMIGLFLLGAVSELPDKALFMTVYTLSVAFYMPTLALSNTVAFSILRRSGLDTVKDFPPIRVLGTVGFIVTMWVVNCLTWDGVSLGFTLGESVWKFQYTHMQFLVSGVLGVILFLYTFTLPDCPLQPQAGHKSLSEAMGVSAFRLFKDRRMAMFFIFSMFLGMSLQVTNGYAGPFLTSFKSSQIAEIASSFAANNATMLISLSQISEALCILMIPFFLRRYGIKMVMLMAMVAWVLRFGFFGVGSPQMPGVILFILSCIVYGVAFDFFNVSGGLFVDQQCGSSDRAAAQGLFMLMTNGLGASIGTLAAGAVVDHYCHWENGSLVGDWTSAWLIFAGYAAVVAILFMIVFKDKAKSPSVSDSENDQDPGGMIIEER